VVGLEARIGLSLFAAMECVSAVQGHSRSMSLVPIESVYETTAASDRTDGQTDA